MKITRDNYEQYFLDHVEGTLSPEMERELALFLELNPDLKPVLEDFDASPLPKLEIKNETLKNRLKKNIHPTLHINEANVDEWMIKETEGLLSESESGELQDFIRLNPAYAFDRKLYALTRMQPDLSLTFLRKSELKKRAPVVLYTRLAWTVSAAAAVILLVLGIRFLNRPESSASLQETLPTARVIPDDRQEISEPVVGQADEPEHVVAQKGTPSAIRRTPTPAPAQRTSSFRMQPEEAVAINAESPAVLPEPALFAYTPAKIELPEAKKESSFAAKVFGNVLVKARNAVRGNPDLNRIREADISLWSLAEAGVKGFNTISDRDLELIVRKDEEGNIKSYALVEEDRLLLTRSRGNN